MSRLTALFVACFVLVACSSSEAPAPAPETEPADAAPAAATAPPPPAAPAIPVGECGAQDAVPAEQRIANTPKWSTASELENFGFDVYRGDSEEGPFERLTESPILGAGTSDEPHQYSFRDDSIDPCKDYWYYVEAISTSGAREKFTPTFRAPAKRRAAE